MIQIILKNGLEKDYKVETLEAQPKLSDFDYWLQFIGLACSFAGLSLHELTTIAIEFIALKVKKRKVRIGLFYLKWTLISVDLIFFGYLSTQRALDYKAEEANPVEKEKIRSFIQPKIVQLAICVRIKMFSGNYEVKTMLEIERAADGVLNDQLEGIYTSCWKRSFRSKYQVHPKVLFKKMLYGHYRCFRLSIHPNYQAISPDPKLTIEFKKNSLSYNYAVIYLLSINENLSGKSFEYSGRFVFRERIVRRLKLNGRCVDYEEKYAGNCTGRWNCVERCIARKHMDRYNEIAFGKIDDDPIIDKDWFSQAEWNTAQQIFVKYEKLSSYEVIRAECLKEIPDG